MTIVRKNVCLDSNLISALEQIAEAKGGRRQGCSFSAELNRALEEYVQRETMKGAVASGEWERLLDAKFAELEAWLRPVVMGSSTYGTAATLLMLEYMCGKRLDPSEAKEHFEMIRERASKIHRRVKDQDEGA